MYRDQPKAPAALITVDSSGHIAAWDTLAPSTLGWTEDLVLEAHVGDLIDAGAARNEFDDWLAAVTRSALQEVHDTALRTTFLTRDGAVIDGLVRCEPSCLCPDTRFLYVYLTQGIPDAPTTPRWCHHSSSQLH